MRGGAGEVERGAAVAPEHASARRRRRGGRRGRRRASAPASAAPPSTSAWSTPRPRERLERGARGRRRAARGRRHGEHLGAGGEPRVDCASSGAASVVTTSVGASVGSNSGPVGGHAAAASSTTRSGCARRARSTSRTVRRGRSASAVPAPTTTACESARSSWASARAAAPVIHCDEPSRAAMRPSRLIAVFTHGERAAERGGGTRYGASEVASAASAPTPTSTVTPWARSAAIPAPRPCGSGSSSATTTRATPASTSASTQGGVRPWCEHGSRVT